MTLYTHSPRILLRLICLQEEKDLILSTHEFEVILPSYIYCTDFFRTYFCAKLFSTFLKFGALFWLDANSKFCPLS